MVKLFVTYLQFDKSKNETWNYNKWIYVPRIKDDKKLSRTLSYHLLTPIHSLYEQKSSQLEIKKIRNQVSKLSSKSFSLKKNIYFIIEFGGFRVNTGNIIKNGKKIDNQINLRDGIKTAHSNLTSVFQAIFENTDNPHSNTLEEILKGRNLLIQTNISIGNPNILDIDADRNISNTQYGDEFFVIWDNITFGKDQIMISQTTCNRLFIPVYVKGIFDSLNQIKKEYFNRLYSKKIYKLKTLNNKILTAESPGWLEILNSIELAKDYYDFKFGKTKFQLFKNHERLTNEEIMTLFNQNLNHNLYLKFLAQRQSSTLKIIPIVELIGNNREESFLFRLLTRKKEVLIVWENVNHSRATHIFKVLNDSENIELIIDFIGLRNSSGKRHLLHGYSVESIKLKKELKYKCSINHLNLDIYIKRICSLLEM